MTCLAMDCYAVTRQGTEWIVKQPDQLSQVRISKVCPGQERHGELKLSQARRSKAKLSQADCGLVQTIGAANVPISKNLYENNEDGRCSQRHGKQLGAT